MPPRDESPRPVASLAERGLAAEASLRSASPGGQAGALAGVSALPLRTPLERALVYGAAGLGLEVLFTGAASGFGGDAGLTGTSYAWMLPIYAAGGLLLEQVRARAGERRWWSRGLRYTAAIFAVEYVAGAALRKLLGKCPWHYTSGLHVRGLIRLDYAPFWLGAGLLFERLHGELAQVGTAAQRPQP